MEDSTFHSSYYAANICSTYISNGISDWFLPSIEELKAVMAFLRSSGMKDFFGKGRLTWSSSENENDKDCAYATTISSLELTIPRGSNDLFTSIWELFPVRYVSE